MFSGIIEFKREYTRAISQGYAAVFAGAGLSRSSGYTDWQELLKPLADEIGLDVNKEHDLVAVAQYYRNERGNRSSIEQKILNEFTRSVHPNPNIDTLTRLPISTYWTTNYDELLEEGLKANNRKADVKTTQDSLANNIYDRDAVVYKMHGDVRCPANTVLTKDDYETYNNQRPLFTTALQGDLISKTFLFIGFSFEDPNLDYILSRIRVLLGESVRDHYCFFEKTKNKGDEKDFIYNTIKQELRVKDLRRYGIHAVLLDDYSEITTILQDIERGHLLKSIFISGSIKKYECCWDIEKVIFFTHNLAKRLVEHDYRIVSGFGQGIGSAIVNGALEEIMGSKYKHVDEYLCMRPFPQFESGTIPLDQQWQKYREEMISQSGIALFIFGNKELEEKLVIADGMMKEFAIAKKQGKIIIPLASTGNAAKIIYDKICIEIDQHMYLKPYLDRLVDTYEVDDLIKLVFEIVNNSQII